MIVTEVTRGPPGVAAKMPPDELDDRLTVVVEVTLTAPPDEFSTWQTIGPNIAELDADPETGDVVIASFAAVDPVTTVSDIPEPHLLAAALLFESPL